MNFLSSRGLQVRLQAGDLAWSDFRQLGSSNDFKPHIADAYDVTNILFSSGTTGKVVFFEELRSKYDFAACSFR